MRLFERGPCREKPVPLPFLDFGQFGFLFSRLLHLFEFAQLRRLASIFLDLTQPFKIGRQVMPLSLSLVRPLRLGCRRPHHLLPQLCLDILLVGCAKAGLHRLELHPLQRRGTELLGWPGMATLEDLETHRLSQLLKSQAMPSHTFVVEVSNTGDAEKGQ